jgi:hypothetical protein
MPFSAKVLVHVYPALHFILAPINAFSLKPSRPWLSLTTHLLPEKCTTHTLARPKTSIPFFAALMASNGINPSRTNGAAARKASRKHAVSANKSQATTQCISFYLIKFPLAVASLTLPSSVPCGQAKLNRGESE